MELRQLEHFVAVAEEHSFTRAARRANIVQSGLSMSIRALERELGAPLFVRAPRSVGLTPAGRTLLPEARRILANVRGATSAVSETQAALRGTLLVGGTAALPAAFDLPSLLGRFCTAHPGVRVEVRQSSPAALLRAIRSGAVDVGFIGAPADMTPRGVTAVPLGQSPLVFACGPRHRLASRSAVSLATLRRERFIDFGRHWTLRSLVDRVFTTAGIERDTAMVVDDISLLLGLVEQGLGVALVPQVFSRLSGTVCCIPLRGAHPEIRLLCACSNREPPSAAVRALHVMIADALAEADEARPPRERTVIRGARSRRT